MHYFHTGISVEPWVCSHFHKIYFSYVFALAMFSQSAQYFCLKWDKKCPKIKYPYSDILTSELFCELLLVTSCYRQYQDKLWPCDPHWSECRLHFHPIQFVIVLIFSDVRLVRFHWVYRLVLYPCKYCVTLIVIYTSL